VRCNKSPNDPEPYFPETPEEIQEWLAMFKIQVDSNDPQGLLRFLSNETALTGPVTHLRRSLANLFTANILSAPRTVALNVVGPALVQSIRATERVAGGYSAAVIHAARGNSEQVRLSLAASKAAGRAYAQMFGDMGLALDFAKQAVKENRPILGGHQSVNDVGEKFARIDSSVRNAYRKHSNRELDILGSQQIADGAYMLGNLINTWPRAFSSVNNGLDEFSKRLAYMGEARVNGIVEAEEQGLKGAELEAHVRTRVDESFTQEGAAANEDFLREAERTTFTGAIGTEDSLARKSANFVNAVRTQIPEARAILPVFNVPANALGETIRRIPIINLALKENRDELLGLKGPLAQNEAHGRMLVGGAFLGIGYQWASSGVITGAGPSDPAERATWRLKHQPYSIRIGDKWVDYSRFDILGTILSIPADTFDNSVHRETDRNLFELMATSTSALSEFFRDRAALQSVSELLNLGQSDNQDIGFFERLAASTASGLTTPNFLTSLARDTGDPTVNTTTGIWKRVLDRIPGFSSTLENRKNIWGEDIRRPRDTLVEGALPLTISPAVTFEDDPASDELARLMESTGWALDPYSDRRLGEGQVDTREAILDNGKSLSWNFLEKLRTVEINGMTAKEAVADLIQSDRYAAAVDADASNRTVITGEESRAALISEVYSDYRKEARRELVRNDRSAAKLLALIKIRKAASQDLEGVTFDELNSEEGDQLLLDLGIDIEQFADELENK